jgi:hypothetical protein
LGLYSIEPVLAAPRGRHVHRAIDRESAHARDRPSVLIGIDHRRTTDFGDKGTAAGNKPAVQSAINAALGWREDLVIVSPFARPGCA